MMDRAAPVSHIFPRVLAAGLVVMAAGGLANDAGGWYAALAKPSWQPPTAVFGPVWLVIVLAVALAVTLVLRAEGDGRSRAVLLGLVACNAVLAVAWTVLFFRMHRPDWALAEIVPFWLSIVALAAAAWARSRRAGWLFAPYLGWATFAAALNLAIVERNAPFNGT